jgi:hypothetical protein
VHTLETLTSLQIYGTQYCGLFLRSVKYYGLFLRRYEQSHAGPQRPNTLPISDNMHFLKNLRFRLPTKSFHSRVSVRASCVKEDSLQVQSSSLESLSEEKLPEETEPIDDDSSEHCIACATGRRIQRRRPGGRREGGGRREWETLRNVMLVPSMHAQTHKHFCTEFPPSDTKTCILSIKKLACSTWRESIANVS